jgi:UDP-2,4-diacetamido-2,4,6-trideoxy-beta-L-altropyranose hydrolase
MLIRVDASPQIGSGHVMRCLALAQIWRASGGKAKFLMSDSTKAIDDRLKAAGLPPARLTVQRGTLADARETIACARQHDTEWIVSDGYAFTSDYQRTIKDGGAQLLSIDDGTVPNHFCADFVLNQNVYADECLYPHHDASTQLLCGPSYALLREEFYTSVRRQRETPDVAHKLLVTLGGSDPINATQKVIEALDRNAGNGLKVIVLIGGSNRNESDIRHAAKHGNLQLQLIRDASNMPELMGWADVAISGAGTTTLELAYMGVPSLLIVVAENQRRVADAMQAEGAAINLGDALALPASCLAVELNRLVASKSRRSEMTKRAQMLVDGRGARRTCEVLRTGVSIRFRAVNRSDAELLWRWANDPNVRTVSFQSEPIPWETHMHWFEKKLADPNARIFIAETGMREPLGVARFDVVAGIATISVSLDRRFRGRGFGVRVIREATDQILSSPDIRKVSALIKRENQQSIQAFTQAGFRQVESSPDAPSGAVTMACERIES